MANDANAPSSTQVRVLVVEDEWVVAIDVSACLEGLGYLVVATVASGEEAVVKARELRPNVVLMDIRLAGEMDGVQAAQQIWHELQIPVIYTTGYSDQATVDRATATEPFGYILKPIKERDLYIAIKTALQRYGRETRLREQQEWAATILKAIGDGIIVTDAEGRVKFLNLVAESLTGWQLQDAMNRFVDEVLPLIHYETQTPVTNPVREVLQTGTTTYLANPVLLITKDGRQIPVADSAAPVKDEAGNMTGAVMVFREVIEQQPVQKQSFSLLRAQLLEQQIQELQEVAQHKDEFLSTVSHELRSPLTNIKMSIHLLEMNLDRRSLSPSESEVSAQSQRVEQYLRIIREQCDQELNLVNDLLELQRLEAEGTPVEQTPIDVVEWISQLAEAYQGRTQERQQTLQVHLPTTLPPLVSDLPVLTHILRELLTNACKYTPPGEVITVSAQSTEDQLQLWISNSGITISPEELPRVFDKFYRIPGSDRWNQGGTGLGLALVKKQIEYLGGSIRAESTANEIRFVLELPLNAQSSILST
jgi:PAS domain S-box-containing protein